MYGKTIWVQDGVLSWFKQVGAEYGINYGAGLLVSLISRKPLKLDY